MKTGLGVVLCMVLWSATGRADTFYQYRDKSTGRDVFVNRPDQIPRKYRGQAKLVMEIANTPTTPASDSTNSKDESATTKPSATPTVAEPLARPQVG